jgi:hypothetical protein
VPRFHALVEPNVISGKREVTIPLREEWFFIEKLPKKYMPFLQFFFERRFVNSQFLKKSL